MFKGMNGDGDETKVGMVVVMVIMVVVMVVVVMLIITISTINITAPTHDGQEVLSRAVQLLENGMVFRNPSHPHRIVPEWSVANGFPPFVPSSSHQMAP